MENSLDSSQRKVLRGLAHDLKPVVQIGKNGLTDALVNSVDSALERHELIKVRFLDFKDDKKVFSEAIAERLHGNLVGLIGNVAILYRRHPDPEKRKVAVPASKKL